MATTNKKTVELSTIELKSAGLGKFLIKAAAYDVKNDRWINYTFEADDYMLKHIATGITSVLEARRMFVNGFINDVKKALPQNGIEGAKIV